jgi:bla regulator protein BlaR1
MMAVLKIVICSTLFIALYKAVLENERMFRFNRFYLLFTLLAAVAIRFVTFTHTVESIQIPVQYLEVISSQKAIQVNQPGESAISLETGLWLIYGIGFLYFFFVFLKNIRQIFQTIINSEKIVYKDYTLILLDKKVVPHSFLKYIFISDADTVDKDILAHELSHVRQLHTWDILFIELVKVFFWFNPAVYFYRSSMMLNHEFLADEAVLKSADVKSYQNLLLQNILDRSHTATITHGFNYSIIKKRLIMMTKKKSQATVISKILLTVSFSIGIAFLFVERVTAQTLPEKTQETTNISVGKRTGATEEEVKKYYALIEKYKEKDGKLNLNESKEDEKEFLITVSKKMTREQLFIDNKAYMFSTGEIKKMTISSYDFDKWTINKNYSIYIDTKKVSNKTLKKYSPEDFNQYMLTGGQKENKYRIDLTTVTEAARRREIAKKNPSVIYVSHVKLNKSEK